MKHQRRLLSFRTNYQAELTQFQRVSRAPVAGFAQRFITVPHSLPQSSRGQRLVARASPAKAEWLGHAEWLLRPLVDLIAAHVMAGRASTPTTRRCQCSRRARAKPRPGDNAGRALPLHARPETRAAMAATARPAVTAAPTAMIPPPTNTSLQDTFASSKTWVAIARIPQVLRGSQAPMVHSFVGGISEQRSSLRCHRTMSYLCVFRPRVGRSQHRISHDRKRGLENERRRCGPQSRASAHSGRASSAPLVARLLNLCRAKRLCALHAWNAQTGISSSSI